MKDHVLRKKESNAESAAQANATHKFQPHRHKPTHCATCFKPQSDHSLSTQSPKKGTSHLSKTLNFPPSSSLAGQPPPASGTDSVNRKLEEQKKSGKLHRQMPVALSSKPTKFNPVVANGSSHHRENGEESCSENNSITDHSELLEMNIKAGASEDSVGDHHSQPDRSGSSDTPPSNGEVNGVVRLPKQQQIGLLHPKKETHTGYGRKQGSGPSSTNRATVSVSTNNRESSEEADQSKYSIAGTSTQKHQGGARSKHLGPKKKERGKKPAEPVDSQSVAFLSVQLKKRDKRPSQDPVEEATEFQMVARNLKPIKTRPAPVNLTERDKVKALIISKQLKEKRAKAEEKNRQTTSGNGSEDDEGSTSRSPDTTLHQQEASEETQAKVEGEGNGSEVKTNEYDRRERPEPKKEDQTDSVMMPTGTTRKRLEKSKSGVGEPGPTSSSVSNNLVDSDERQKLLDTKTQLASDTLSNAAFLTYSDTGRYETVPKRRRETSRPSIKPLGEEDRNISDPDLFTSTEHAQNISVVSNDQLESHSQSVIGSEISSSIFFGSGPPTREEIQEGESPSSSGALESSPRVVTILNADGTVSEYVETGDTLAGGGTPIHDDKTFERENSSISDDVEDLPQPKSLFSTRPMRSNIALPDRVVNNERKTKKEDVKPRSSSMPPPPLPLLISDEGENRKSKEDKRLSSGSSSSYKVPVIIRSQSPSSSPYELLAFAESGSPSDQGEEYSQTPKNPKPGTNKNWPKGYEKPMIRKFAAKVIDVAKSSDAASKSSSQSDEDESQELKAKMRQRTSTYPPHTPDFGKSGQHSPAEKKSTSVRSKSKRAAPLPPMTPPSVAARRVLFSPNSTLDSLPGRSPPPPPLPSSFHLANATTPVPISTPPKSPSPNHHYSSSPPKADAKSGNNNNRTAAAALPVAISTPPKSASPNHHHHSSSPPKTDGKSGNNNKTKFWRRPFVRVSRQHRDDELGSPEVVITSENMESVRRWLLSQPSIEFDGDREDDPPDQTDGDTPSSSRASPGHGLAVRTQSSPVKTTSPKAGGSNGSSHLSKKRRAPPVPPGPGGQLAGLVVPSPVLLRKQRHQSADSDSEVTYQNIGKERVKKVPLVKPERRARNRTTGFEHIQSPRDLNHIYDEIPFDKKRRAPQPPLPTHAHPAGDGHDIEASEIPAFKVAAVPNLRSVLKHSLTDSQESSDSSESLHPRRPVRIIEPSDATPDLATPDQPTYANLHLVPPHGRGESGQPAPPDARQPAAQVLTCGLETLGHLTRSWLAFEESLPDLGDVQWDQFTLLGGGEPCCTVLGSAFYSVSHPRHPDTNLAIQVYLGSDVESFDRGLALRQSLPAHPNVYAVCARITLDSSQLPAHLPALSLDALPMNCPPSSSSSSQSPVAASGGHHRQLRAAVANVVPVYQANHYVKHSKELHEFLPKKYERDVTLLLLQLFQGLAHVERHGLRLGGLKLDHLLVAQSRHPGKGAQLVIANFDSAKPVSEAAEPAADRLHQFDAGLLLYRFLHLPNPFETKTSLITEDYGPGDLPPIAERSGYSRGLGRLAGMLLSKRQDRRPSTVQAVQFLQCLLWGPPAPPADAAGEGEGESWLQEWLDLERARKVGQVAEQYLASMFHADCSGLTLGDQLHCQFLADITAPQLGQAYGLLYSTHSS